jgi:TP901 family phage tail tape measure protein
MAEFWVKVKVDPSGAQRGAKQVKGALGGVEQKAKQLHGMLLRTFGAIGLAAGAGVAIKTLADFGQEMSTVQAITQATAADFAQLRDVAKELGASTRFSASQAAEGMKFLARSGFEVAEVAETIDDTLRLAQAGALGLGEAASISANVLRGFRLETDQATRVVDVLALAANSANTDVRQLGDAMRFVAPVAAGVGIQMETAAAAIGALSDAGLQASMAGTGLRRVLSTLEAPTSMEIKLLDKLGISADEVRVSQVGLIQALKRLESAGVDTGKALELFGDRGGPAFEVMVKNIPKIIELEGKLNNAAGTAKRISDIMDDNLKGALFAVKSAFEAVIIAMGETGSETGLTDFLRSSADGLRALARNMDTVVHVTKALGIALAITFSPQILGQAVFLVAKLSQGLVTLSASMTALSAKAAMTSVSMGKVSGATVAFRIAAVKLGGALKALWAIIIANPLIAIGAVAIAGFTFMFDQMNKKMAEAEAQQNRAHSNALKMIRAKLREVQAQAEANKSLDAFIKAMERENTLLGLTVEKRTEETAIMKALELAKRVLTATERETIINLLEQKRLIVEHNKRLQEEAGLLEKILGPQKDYEHQLDLLNTLLAKGSINQEQYTRTLQEMQETYGITGTSAIDEYLARLKQENDLLKMNQEEQELTRALMSARAAAGQDLTAGQVKAVEALVQEKRAQEDLNIEMDNYNRLLNEIRGPQLYFAEQTNILKQLLHDGEITLDMYIQKYQELQETLQTGEILPPGLERGLQRLKEEISDVGSLAEHTLVNAFHGAQDALISFVTTGEINFKRFVDGVLADLTRLLMNKLLMSLISGIGGGGGALATGASGIPGFQHGGSFVIGGSGGPDSKTVLFKGTPGERVDVSRPGQTPNVNVAAPQVHIKVVNVDDPGTALTALGSTEGEKIILNTVRKNMNTIRKM